jgi:hypothetical protein
MTFPHVPVGGMTFPVRYGPGDAFRAPKADPELGAGLDYPSLEWSTEASGPGKKRSSFPVSPQRTR